LPGSSGTTGPLGRSRPLDVCIAARSVGHGSFPGFVSGAVDAADVHRHSRRTTIRGSRGRALPDSPPTPLMAARPVAPHSVQSAVIAMDLSPNRAAAVSAESDGPVRRYVRETLVRRPIQVLRSRLNAIRHEVCSLFSLKSRRRQKQLERALRHRRSQKKSPAQIQSEFAPSGDAEESGTEKRRGRSHSRNSRRPMCKVGSISKRRRCEHLCSRRYLRIY
jgi:hypothetical protein